jgi:signal transduction histidine kinase
LLDEKVKDPVRLKEYYSVILGDADNLSRLVGNFLDFAKIEDGKKQYDFKETDISQWMTQTITNMKKEYHQKGIELNTRISADIPHLAIDKNAMGLVINNLLDNAIKFSSGQIVVEVIVERDEKNLFLKVRDNGIGIHKEDLNKIFEKFYRGKNAPSHISTGTGLGLTLVRQIIEAHGGEVSVDSNVGSGSTFTLILPYYTK